VDWRGKMSATAREGVWVGNSTSILALFGRPRAVKGEHTLWCSEMDDISVLLEHVHLLNALDWLHVHLLQRRLELLVVGSRALVHLLDLSSWGTLSTIHQLGQLLSVDMLKELRCGDRMLTLEEHDVSLGFKKGSMGCVSTRESGPSFSTALRYSHTNSHRLLHLRELCVIHDGGLFKLPHFKSHPDISTLSIATTSRISASSSFSQVKAQSLHL
jgi:hypothetical protein